MIELYQVALQMYRIVSSRKSGQFETTFLQMTMMLRFCFVNRTIGNKIKGRNLLGENKVAIETRDIFFH